MNKSGITTNVENDISGEFALHRKVDHFLPLREDAMDAFTRTGFPSSKSEEWKYVNLGKILSETPGFNHQGISGKLNASDIDRFRLADKDVLVLVFENGIYNRSLSDELNEEDGISILNFASHPENNIVSKHLGKIADYQNEPFVALNTAFAPDGLVIHVSRGKEIRRTVHFMHITTTTDKNRVSSVRNLVVADENSRLSVVESFHSLTEISTGITNSVTEMAIHAGAHIELIKAQLESDNQSHISFTQVVQERDSTFDGVTVTLGGELVRNNLHIRLTGENCTSHLYGLYILDDHQLVDNHTLVDHVMPHCFSNELYKGIIDGKASGVFNGKVFVRKDAQKTNAYQSNKNILLSNDAQMNSKPQLEIFADDVKCTHGATTGQLDEEALFYLRSRGIGEQNAKALLNIAFVSDVLNNIKSEELRHKLQDLAEMKLKEASTLQP